MKGKFNMILFFSKVIISTSIICLITGATDSAWGMWRTKISQLSDEAEEAILELHRNNRTHNCASQGKTTACPPYKQKGYWGSRLDWDKHPENACGPCQQIVLSYLQNSNQPALLPYLEVIKERRRREAQEQNQREQEELRNRQSRELEETFKMQEVRNQQDLEQSQRDFQETNKTISTGNEIGKTQEHSPIVDEENSLFSRVNVLKAINLKNEEKIREMTEKEEEFNNYKVKTEQNLESIRNEKEELTLNTTFIRKVLLERDNEIENLRKEKEKLALLMGEQEASIKVIKEMMKIIGIKTDDFNDCVGGIFAKKCLDRLKDRVENI